MKLYAVHVGYFVGEIWGKIAPNEYVCLNDVSARKITDEQIELALEREVLKELDEAPPDGFEEIVRAQLADSEDTH